MIKSILSQRGFTLVELVLTLVIIGIISVVALPRFFNRDSFEDRGFYTEVLNAVRYAQQLAVATNCDVQITLTANTYTLNIWSGADCGTGTLTGDAPDPVTGQLGFTGSNTSASITLNGGSPNIFQFDALGQANNDIDATVGGYQFVVHASTGYIEER